jgi:hypothetical protein
MITLSIGVFFWLSIGYLFLKYKLNLAPYMVIAFFITVIGLMSGINIRAMSDCNTPEMAILYTFIPWFFIFVPMLIVLYYFPNWLIPFSNTIGYFIISFDKANINTLVSLLKNKEKNMVMVTGSPWVLLNKFTPDMFNVAEPKEPSLLPEDDNFSQKGGSPSNVFLEALNLSDTENIQKLKEILELKDLISLWVWYMLTALITISTSYTLIMNNSCSKDTNPKNKSPQST